MYRFFTPLEAECPAACRGDKCQTDCANAVFSAPRELLTGFTLSIILWLPLVAEAAGAPRNLTDLANQITGLFSSATAALVLLGLIAYFWGITENILKFGEEGWVKIKAYFLWGVIVVFVMVSIWGILHVLYATVFGSDPFSSGGGGTNNNSAPCNFGDANCGGFAI